MRWKTLDDLDLANKVVLTRVDINVPMEGDRVTDATRIDRIKPTVDDIIAKGGRVVLLAHFGRPKGEPDPALSLARVVPALEQALGRRVIFASDCIGEAARDAIASAAAEDVVLLENTRFHPEEKKNDPQFAARLAELGQVYVSDAFSAAHRAHVSTEALARLLPCAAGRLMEAELSALEKALGAPQRPLMAVVGGSKVSTKIELLGNLVSRVDHLVIGGGMANTFLAAKGIEIGKSLAEHDMTEIARDIMARAAAANCRIHLPSDIVVARELKPGIALEIVPADACPGDMMILDAGPETVRELEKTLASCRTLIWNGPLGAFEISPFDAATEAVAEEAARLTRAGKLISVAGGGDTVAALNQAGVSADFSFISTAGGAFLEWMEGKTLPGVAALLS